MEICSSSFGVGLNEMFGHKLGKSTEEYLLEYVTIFDTFASFIGSFSFRNNDFDSKEKFQFKNIQTSMENQSTFLSVSRRCWLNFIQRNNIISLKKKIVEQFALPPLIWRPIVVLILENKIDFIPLNYCSS